MGLLVIGVLFLAGLYVVEKKGGLSALVSGGPITNTGTPVGPPIPRPLPLPPIKSLNTPPGASASDYATSAVPVAGSIGLAAGGPVGGAIASGIASVGAFITKLIQGCGQVCIDASKVNQVFYAATQNLKSLMNAGFVSSNTAAACVDYWSQACQQDFQNNPQGQAGLSLTQRTLSAFRNSLGSVRATKPFPSDPTQYYIRGPLYGGAVAPSGLPGAEAACSREALNLPPVIQATWLQACIKAAQAKYPGQTVTPSGFALSPSEGGSWYPDSLDQGDQLTTSTLNANGLFAGVQDPN